ncbi:MAG TPA: hypothetical protein VN660_03310 [Steroidobacteraceae bacterium]|nr:hypothetical protein [Steroidobacteraceae bacterium]
MSQAQAASSGGTNGWVDGTTTPGNGAQSGGAASSPLAGYGLIAAGNLASGWAQGAAQEKIQEQQQQEENYYGNLWNPVVKYYGNVGGAGVINAAGGTPSSPNPGYLSMAQNIAGFMARRPAATALRRHNPAAPPTSRQPAHRMCRARLCQV